MTNALRRRRGQSAEAIRWACRNGAIRRVQAGGDDVMLEALGAPRALAA